MYDPNFQAVKFHLKDIERNAQPYRKIKRSASHAQTSPVQALVATTVTLSLIVGVFSIASIIM